jgi:hypothetical protein
VRCARSGVDGTDGMLASSSGTLSKLGDSRVGPNAHVVAMDIETHRIHLPLKNLGRPTMLRILEPKRQGAS